MESFLELYIFATFEEVANFFQIIGTLATETPAMLLSWLETGGVYTNSFINIVSGERVTFSLQGNILTDILSLVFNVFTAVIPQRLMYSHVWIAMLVGSATWLLPVALFKFFKGVLFK